MRIAIALLIIALAAQVVGAGGCDKTEAVSASPTPAPSPKSPVEFPDELRVEDQTVNDFIVHAIEVCASGDYEAFRLLWTARKDPITEKEFRRGWLGNPTVRIEQVKQYQTPEKEIVYAVRAHVELDPAEVPEPVRDIVLLLVRESGEWRVAEAPKSVRKELKADTEPETKPAAASEGADESASTGASP